MTPATFWTVQPKMMNSNRPTRPGQSTRTAHPASKTAAVRHKPTAGTKTPAKKQTKSTVNGSYVLVFFAVILLIVLIRSIGGGKNDNTAPETAQTTETPQTQIVEEASQPEPTAGIVDFDALYASAQEEKTVENHMLPVLRNNESMKEKKVAITIDDLTVPANLDAILDLCETYGFRITLFALGKNASINSSQLKRAYRMGCEIGNHTYDHTFTYSPDDAGLIKEMRDTEVAVNNALGFAYHMKLWRCPGGNGSYDPRLHNMLYEEGYEAVVFWNVSARDMKTVKKQVTPGSILLYHTKDSDVKFLRQLIPALYNAGYTSVTVGELMGYSDEQVSELPGIYPDFDTLEYSYDDTTFKLKTRMYGVALLQERLAELGYLNESGVDGDYGSGTETAVKQAQTDAGLPVTGEADPEFRKLLFSENAPHAPFGYVIPTTTTTTEE